MFKKVLCGIVALALIITAIPLNLIINATNDGPEKTVYVSAQGSDATGTGEQTAPYATISKAITDVESDAAAGSGRVVLLDQTTYSTSEHTKKMTVCGITKDVVLVGGTGDEFIKGDMQFENITFDANIVFVTSGHNLTFGDNTKNTKAITTYIGGAAITTQGETYISKPFDTIDNWQYRTIYIGNNDNYVANGDMNVFVSGGYYHMIRLSNGKYNGNVNIVLDSVQRCKSDSKVSVNKTPDINGAIQVVLNGGLDRKQHLTLTASGNITPFKNYPADDGVWLMYVGANSIGGKLSTTQTAGSFSVEGEGVAKAYKITTDDDGNETSRETEPSAVSRDGILDLSGKSKAGEYVVLFSEYEASANTDSTVYVSADGKNSNDGKTLNTAFQTIDFAEKWLEKSTAEGEKTIIVDGKVSFDGGEPHTKMITIKGNDDTAELEFTTSSYTEIDKAVVLQGPTTFDSIIIPYSASNNDSLGIVTNGNKTLFKNIKTEAWKWYDIYVGNVENKTDSQKREDVYIDGSGDSGYVNKRIRLGAFGDTVNRNSNGVNFEQKAGRITTIQFYGATFTDNVNITLNGVKPRQDSLNAGEGIGLTYNANITKFEGALQLVLNNGQSEYFKNLSTWESINALGGTWIMCGETNETNTILETTSVEGEFKVNGKYIAKAYLVTQGLVSTTPIVSENGKLTVPAGRYVVKFTPREPVANSDSVVYVSASGDNYNNGKTVDTAFATLDFALGWLNKSTTTDERKIIVVGEMNLVTAEHTNMITVEGYDENAVLISTRDIAFDLCGPTKFQNIKLKDVMFSTNGDQVILGEGITRVGGKEVMQIGGSGATNGENFTINNWTNSLDNVWTLWNSLYIGNNANYVANGDVNVTVNGGTYNQLFIRNGTFNKNINITLNGAYTALQGNSSKIAVGATTSPVINGAVQVILNGGLSTDSYVLRNDNADCKNLYDYNIGGGLWVISGKEGGSLSATETAGEYKVSGGKIAYVKIGNKIYYGNAVINLKLPAGEYTVSYIDTLAELKASVVAVPEVGMEFVSWEDDENGTLTAKFQTDTIDYRNYYIAPGGTGDGRSIDTPAGSVQAVLSSINADRMTSLDVATVYIDGSTQPDTWASDEQNHLFIQYNSTIDHVAKVIYTSLDFEKHPAKLAFTSDWGLSAGVGDMYIQGPTVFKDIWLVDQWANEHGSRFIVTNGHDVTFENAIRYEANINEEETELRPGNTRDGENAYIYTGSAGLGQSDIEPYSAHGLGNGGVITIDGATLERQRGIIFGTHFYSSYNVLNTLTENTTAVINGDNLKYVYLTQNAGRAGQIMTYEKNVNLIANGTAIDTVDTNLSVKVGDVEDGYGTPIIKGAVQILLNNGASIKNNYAYAYKDESKTEKTPFYILSSAENAGGTLDVTENTGEFKVNGTKIAYVLTDGKIYYGNASSNLKIGKSGTYDVKYVGSIEEIKQNVITSYGEISTWDDDSNGTITFKLKNPNYMLHIKNSGNGNESISLDLSGLEAGKKYTVSYEYKRLSGKINYKGAYLALFGGNANSGFEITNYGKIYRDGLADNDVSDFTVINNDGLNAEYTFKLSADEINDGNFKLGFYFSDKDYGKDVDFYIANLTVYETADASKKNLLVNDSKKPDVHGWNTNSYKAVSGESSFEVDKITAEYMLCDLTFFKKTEESFPPEKMVQFQNVAGWGGVEHAVPLEIGVTYRLEFYASKDTASRPSFNTDGNRYGICYLTKVESSDYGNYTHYIYEATIPETASNGMSINATSFVSLAVPSMMGGFFFGITLYDVADPEKANMLTNADFKDGLNDWNYDWSAWFVPNRTGYGFTEWYSEDRSKFIKVLDYDEKAFITYKDDENFNDGEWWSADDIFEKILDYANIKGTLKNINGNPLKNIKLGLVSGDNTYTTVTDKNGAFDFGKIAIGFYSFDVYNKDGEKQNGSVFYTLAKGDELTLNVVISPKSEETENKDGEKQNDSILKGAVYTPKLKTIPNMKIYLRGIGETVTDENGAFEFINVPVGEYDIYTLNDDGSEYVFRTVKIEESVKLTVKLKYDNKKTDSDNKDTENSGTEVEKKDVNIALIIIIVISAIVVLGAIVLTMIIVIKRARKKS